MVKCYKVRNYKAPYNQHKSQLTKYALFIASTQGQTARPNWLGWLVKYRDMT